MKVYIVHGWDGNPQEPMFQWLKTSLESRDYDVVVLAMPHPEAPMIEAWVEKLTKAISPGPETILIGHSIGCQAILRYLEATGNRVKAVVLIAPWTKLDKKVLKKEGKEMAAVAKPWMETPIDFTKVKTLAGKVVAIFSDNDPYVPLAEKDFFEQELDAKTLVEKKKGHFREGDGIIMLPSALNAVLEL
jgi:predicted alpha/beta hydrolase family esterase